MYEYLLRLLSNLQ